MEAFHYRYHPLAARVREILDAREIGRVRRVETWLCFPLPKFSDIRYNHALAGGALMDAGCYAVHMARFLGGEEPEVVSATAKLHRPDVDRAMRAELRFPSGHTGTVHCSMWSSTLLRIFARVEGEHGELRISNPVMPQLWHKLVVIAGGEKRVERVTKRPTYEFQLQAFCDAVLRGAPTLTPPSDAVANMRVIDAIYRAAGMHPRTPSG
jgi:predicted dehydrogenase